MENAMFAQDQGTRRRLDGSMDIDFYRQKGLMERRAVMTRFFKGVGKLRRPLAAAAPVIAALYAIAPRDGTAGHGPGTGQTSTSITRSLMRRCRSVSPALYKPSPFDLPRQFDHGEAAVAETKAIAYAAASGVVPGDCRSAAATFVD